MTGPTSGISGGTINLSYTVQNKGQGTTDAYAWGDDVELTTAPDANHVVRELGQFSHVGTVGPGASYTRNLTATIPIDLGSAGTYYLMVRNGSSNDNTYTDKIAFSSGFPITLAPAPDLVVTSVLAPIADQVKGTMDVTWTVHNQGLGDAVGVWSDDVSLRDSSGKLHTLGIFNNATPLPAGKDYQRTERLALTGFVDGGAITAGAYQVVVQTNPVLTSIFGGQYQSLFEGPPPFPTDYTFTDPDTLVLTYPPVPDLQVLPISAPPTVDAGNTVTATFVVINRGQAVTPSHWSDTVYLSLVNHLDSTAQAIGTFDNGAALDVGQSYQTTTSPMLIPKLANGSYFLIVKADSGNAVDEGPNKDNNTAVSALTVNPLKRSDLVTSQVVVDPTTAYENTPVNVLYTVTNKGLGATDVADWSDTVWLTTDLTHPDVSKGDFALGTVNHHGVLQIGDSYNGQATVTLPQHISGKYYLTMWTNSYNQVLQDTLDANINPNDAHEIYAENYNGTPLTVLQQPPADLVVTAVNPDPTGVAGTPFAVSYTVTNQGAGTTSPTDWYDQIYLTTTPTLYDRKGQTWFFGPEQHHSGALAPGQSYTVHFTDTLAQPTTANYVIVQTNLPSPPAFSSTYEGPYTNNDIRVVSTSITNRAPDLQVTAITLPPQPVYSGDVVPLSWTVQNLGVAPVTTLTQSWLDRVYLSPDPSGINGLAQIVAEVTHSNGAGLAAGGSYTANATIMLPHGVGGNYFIYVVTDAYDSGYAFPSTGIFVTDYELTYYSTHVYEGINEGNNTLKATLPVIYKEPDLQVTSVVLPTTPVHSGDTIPVTFTVTNTGLRDVPPDEQFWYDRVYLSHDSTLSLDSIELGEAGHQYGLASGASYSVTLNVTIPEGSSGNYYLNVFTDSNLVGAAPPEVGQLRYDSSYYGGIAGRVQEFAGEANNITSVLLPIILTPLPDLQTSEVDLPAQLLAGQAFNLHYTVVNNGGDTPPRQPQWDARFYVSRSQVFDPSTAIYVGFTTHKGGLQGGGSYQDTQTFRMPVGQTGTFYGFVVLDPPDTLHPRGLVFESNENNNTTVSAIPMVVNQPPPADLQLLSVTVPNSAVVGSQQTITWTVQNTGVNPASGSWSDSLYLSTSSTWDLSAIPIGKAVHQGPVNPGDSYTGSLQVTIPPVAEGQYRVIVRSDIFAEVYETNRVNNVAASADTVNVTVSALVLGVPLATTLSTGDVELYKVTVGANQTLEVDLTTDAGQAFNQLYLRAGNVPTGTSYDSSGSGPLQANQTALIPSTQPGVYYVLIRGQSEPGPATPVTLLARLLPFEITDVIPDQGGDSKYVTTTIKGAQFDPQAIVKLVRPTFAEYEPVSYKVVDATTITAIFDLTDAPHGLYDVEVINPDGEKAYAPYRYMVETALPPNIEIGLSGDRILYAYAGAPAGDVGRYAFSLQSLSNVDTRYVYFEFGAPNVPGQRLAFTSNLTGNPSVTGVPWADLDTAVNSNGQLLAPGYVLNLPDQGYQALNFDAATYPTKVPDVDPNIGAFTFHIQASATALSRDEFVAQQTQEAMQLRSAILADTTAAPALVLLASNADAWTGLYLKALVQAGLLLPDGTAPSVDQLNQVDSLMHTLAAGVLAGPAGQQIITSGDLVSFFTQVRQWYGDTPTATFPSGNSFPLVAAPLPNSAYNLGTSQPTHHEAFNVYLRFTDSDSFDDEGSFYPDQVTGPTVAAPNTAALLQGAAGAGAQLSGPSTTGSGDFVPVGQDLPYTIRFSRPTGAAVHEMQIVTALDPNIDERSVRLGDMQLGDLQIHAAGQAFFQSEFDFTQSKGFVLSVTAAIDLSSRTMYWDFRALDPATHELLTDPNIGLLLNTGSDPATGFVTFTAQVRAGTPTGTVITTQARVIPDTAPPSDTNPVTVNVDGVGPTTTVTAQPTAPGSSNYDVRWTAQDDPGGSGVQWTDVFVQEDGGPFTLLQAQSTGNEAIYSGASGHTYTFVAVAVDQAGNVGAPSTAGVQLPGVKAGNDLGNVATVNQTTAQAPAVPAQKLG